MYDLRTLAKISGESRHAVAVVWRNAVGSHADAAILTRQSGLTLTHHAVTGW